MTFAQTWDRWGTTCSVVTTQPEELLAARRGCDRVMDEVEDALSTWRDDTEIVRLRAGWNHVSPVLAGAITAALWAARTTGGAVDPTIGEAVLRWRDGSAGPGRDATTAHWTDLEVLDHRVWLPDGVRLDLGALGKAYAADLAAHLVRRRIGGGVLVNLGGDIATAGAGPVHGWQVRVQDAPSDPELVVTLEPGMAIATSSTLHRRTRPDAPDTGHVLDPRSGRSVSGPWRTATAVARTCVAANTWSTAALVLGDAVDDWLTSHPAPLRLVDHTGQTHQRCTFPRERAA
ncbi:FAD:protein FMN transferase [Nocardioides sp. GCM10027113]|uniref:FAD:protein FMN transferase n=1 Tax=unclassified Nocardioides TaxID=2615069 RepID=UPI003617EFFA